MTTVWTSWYPPSSHSTFLASYSIPHFKKALLSCSVLLLITAVVAYFATSLTCSLGISNDSNYSSLCGQSLSAFSYYPQATSSAVSYSSIKIRNWVLFLSPVPSPCSLQQAVNTSDSQTAKIKTQDTYPPYCACRHSKITPYSTLSLCVTFFPSKLSLPPFFFPTSKLSAITVLNADVNISLFQLAGIHVNLSIVSGSNVCL